MKTRIVEVTNGFNWGKFLVARFDSEWERRAAVEGREGAVLLHSIGFDPRALLVLDLQTTEGAFFRHGGLASADLQKHQIWVCPMFEPFLNWLYQQDVTELDALPDIIDLPGTQSALAGYRRPGLVGDYLIEKLKADVENMADDPIPIGEELLEYWADLRRISWAVGFDPVSHLLENATPFELERLRGLGVPG